MSGHDFNWLRVWELSPPILKDMGFTRFKYLVLPIASEDDWALLKKWFNAPEGTFQQNQYFLPYEMAIDLSLNIRVFNNTLTKFANQSAREMTVGLRNPQQQRKYLALKPILWMIANEDFSPLITAQHYYEALLGIWTRFKKNDVSIDEFNQSISEFCPPFPNGPIRVIAKRNLSIVNLIYDHFDAQNKETLHIDQAPANSTFEVWLKQFFEGYFNIRNIVQTPITKPGQYKTHFDTYEKIEKIGEGGSGEVYKIKDESGNIYALKILNKGQQSKEKTSRFKNELYFCLKSCCPEIVSVVDFGVAGPEENNSFFYIMKYYVMSLRKALPSLNTPQKKLDAFKRILNGVSYAHHKNVWHRDLKPENILCSGDINEFVIADFGIAHFEEDFITEIETRPDTRLANFQYAAPEQRSKGEQVTSAADIYSLGLILNEMFTGQIPGGTDYKKVNENYPKYSYIDKLVENMIKREPTKRPTADDVKNSLNVKNNIYNFSSFIKGFSKSSD